MPRGPLEAASKELSCAQAPRHSLSCANHVAQCVTRPTESTSRTKFSMRILSFPFNNHPFKKHPLNIHPFKIQPLNIHPSRYFHSTPTHLGSIQTATKRGVTYKHAQPPKPQQAGTDCQLRAYTHHKLTYTITHTHDFRSSSFFSLPTTHTYPVLNHHLSSPPQSQQPCKFRCRRSKPCSTFSPRRTG